MAVLRVNPNVTIASRAVPPKYDKNIFTATAWYEIDKHYRLKGEWLTFSRFRQIDSPHARQCHEKVFEQILSEIKLDRVLNPDNEPEPPPPEDKTPRPHENYIREARTSLGDAVVDGLKTAQNRFAKQAEPSYPKREPITAARREEGIKWIADHLDESYPIFKIKFPEPDFDLAWYNKWRADAIDKRDAAKLLTNITVSVPTPEPTLKMENSALSMPKIEFDPRTKEEVRKAANWLLTLGTTDKISSITHGDYKNKTRQNITSMQFHSARRIVLAFLKGTHRSTKARATTKTPFPRPPKLSEPASTPAPDPKPSRARAVDQNPYAGRTALVTLASVSAAAFKDISSTAIRSLIQEIFKQMNPEQEAPEVAFMADPPSIEVRARVTL